MRKRKKIPDAPTQQMAPDQLKATLEGARRMAKSSCKRCYGTGVMGTRIVSLEKRTILICHCVEKMAGRIRATQAAREIDKNAANQTTEADRESV